MIAPFVIALVALLDVGVRPRASSGYAANILAAFVVLGVLALVMMFISSKPRNRRRR